MEYINAELVGVVLACWIIGYVLKQTPLIPDWSIIYLVTIIAIVFACMLLGFTVQSVIQGILCGAVAVFGNQLVKQGKKGVEGE
ncbi:phage holin family protein [Paenibacillus ihbetae]|nr:phage holin family protein [Paenibacillus ihbetae]